MLTAEQIAKIGRIWIDCDHVDDETICEPCLKKINAAMLVPHQTFERWWHGLADVSCLGSSEDVARAAWNAALAASPQAGAKREGGQAKDEILDALNAARNFVRGRHSTISYGPRKLVEQIESAIALLASPPSGEPGRDKQVSLKDVLAICDEPNPNHYADYVVGARWVRDKVVVLAARASVESGERPLR